MFLCIFPVYCVVGCRQHFFGFIPCLVVSLPTCLLPWCYLAITSYLSYLCLSLLYICLQHIKVLVSGRQSLALHSSSTFRFWLCLSLGCCFFVVVSSLLSLLLLFVFVFVFVLGLEMNQAAKKMNSLVHFVTDSFFCGVDLLRHRVDSFFVMEDSFSI